MTADTEVETPEITHAPTKLRDIVKVQLTTTETIYSLDTSFGIGLPCWTQTSVEVYDMLAVSALMSELPLDTLYDSTKKMILHVHTLEAKFKDQQYQLENLTKCIRNAHETLRIISDFVNEEAEIRGWCDEFDGIIDRVNDQIPFGELTKRAREYALQVTLNVSASTIHTVTITASNIEDAEEELRSNLSEYIDEREIVGDIDCLDDIDIVDIDFASSR